MALLAAASLRRCAAAPSIRRCLLLLSAAATLIAATPSISITPPPPPPPPTTSAAAAASNSPPPPFNPTTSTAPPYVPHGSNIYRDGLYAAFTALSNYTLMSELFLDMDLSWMDAARPCTLLVVRDGQGLDKLFNANTLGTLLAGEFQIQLFPSHALTMSDLLQMTEGGGQSATVQTGMANRTVLVTGSTDNSGTDTGNTVVIFLDGVPIVNGDVFIAPDKQLVAHGIPIPLPTTNPNFKPSVDKGGSSATHHSSSSASFLLLVLLIHLLILPS